ncbi:MAG: hypothetical protein Q7Q71_10985 [Verrucomicrobiota bacterium JB023]|nr:hypothetical protein [Verrucomicrobiota bacterium JB023]
MKRLPAKTWKRRHFACDFTGALFIFGFAFAGAHANHWWFLPSLIAGIATFTLKRIHFRRSRCEKCGATLKRAMKDNSRISFACKRCRIIWDTGLVQDGPPA